MKGVVSINFMLHASSFSIVLWLMSVYVYWSFWSLSCRIGSGYYAVDASIVEKDITYTPWDLQLNLQSETQSRHSLQNFFFS